MTESDLYGSSFDYDGNSPCVFFRPMNPALSVHSRLPEDSPLYIYEKDNLGKRGCVAWTPASPLMGSTSYMSQESSYCSLLNNAVILEDDEIETIPSDEKPVPYMGQRFLEGSSGLQDDVSPIVLNNHRASNKAIESKKDQPSFTHGTNESNSGVIDSFPNTFSTEGRDSSLQEFLNIPLKADLGSTHDDGRLGLTQPVTEYNYPVSSPGPQWSPGIRNGSAFVNTSISVVRTPEETQGMIHVEATLNYLDGIPSTSPASRRRRENDSLMSISAIPVGPTDVVLENSTQLMSETVLIEPADEPLAIPPQIMGNEPSPVRKFTHRRTLSRLGSSSNAPPAVVAMPPGLPSHLIPSPPRPSPKVSCILAPLSTRSGLSSIEREVREAQEGRRKLLDQIRQNRKNFESLQKMNSNTSVTLSNSRFYSPLGPLPPPPPPVVSHRPLSTTATTLSSVTRSARVSRGRSSSTAPVPSSSFFLDRKNTTTISRQVSPTRVILPARKTDSLENASVIPQRSFHSSNSINVTRVSVPKLNVSTTSRSRSVSISSAARPAAARSSSSQRPPWRF